MNQGDMYDGPALTVLTDVMRLRRSGLAVTSARLAALRLSPQLVRDTGAVCPRSLHDRAIVNGYSLSLDALYRVLFSLVAYGLIPPSWIRVGGAVG